MSRLSTYTTLHNVTTIAAHPLKDSDTLIIEFGTGDWKEGSAEIGIHLDDGILSIRLADAINAVMAQRKKELLCCVDQSAA